MFNFALCFYRSPFKYFKNFLEMSIPREGDSFLSFLITLPAAILINLFAIS